MSRTLTYLFVAGCGLFVFMGFLARAKDPHFWWEKIPVFDALFGFLGCIAILLLSKTLGHYWLQKNEDYYD